MSNIYTTTVFSIIEASARDCIFNLISRGMASKWARQLDSIYGLYLPSHATDNLWFLLLVLLEEEASISAMASIIVNMVFLCNCMISATD